MEEISTFFASYINVFKWNDLCDIIIISMVIYWGIRLIRETRAEQLIKGIVILLVATQVSAWLDFNVVNFLLNNTMQVGLLALIIVFQPELRRALEQMGRTRIGDLVFGKGHDNTSTENTIVEICSAVSTMSRERIGGLIVIERETKIGDVVLTGTLMEAKVSAELLLNIFYPNTPLHDGAVIIRYNLIKAAGCLLPLTQNAQLNSELGTRHRAAIGMSENSDSIIVVVSEETGKISIAKGGSLTRNFTPESLKRALEKALLTAEEDKPSGFSRFTGRGKTQ